MIPYSEDEVAALQARTVVKRNFVWLTARDRETGLPHSIGFWNDIGETEVTVVSGMTGQLVARTYVGSGTLIQVGDIPRTADISVRTVALSLSPLSAEVEQAIRGWDLRSAPIEIHRGLFDPTTRQLVGPPKPLFVGLVSEMSIDTGAVGQESVAAIECVSASYELMLGETHVRSDAWLQTRAPGDRFYRWTGVIAEVEMTWGAEAGPAPGVRESPEPRFPKIRAWLASRRAR